MSESTPLSRQCDDAAQLYDGVRPRYPEEIVEHIVAFAALPAQGRVFEVACCQPYPQMRMVPCAFEAWQDTPASYDLFLAVGTLTRLWNRS